jgi:hypothetical protein
MKLILIFIILIVNQTVLIGQTLKESDNFKKAITIEVEAESFASQTKDEIRKWVIQTSDSASLKKYIQIMPDTRVTHDDELIKGVNFSNEQGLMAIVSYKVIIPNAGRYYVWVSALSKGGEDNSVHVGIDNTWPETGARMQWCDGKNNWYYESKQRTEAVHCGEPYLIYLDITKPGKHTIQFSMREDGFAMDKFLLTTDKNFKPVINK